VPTHNTPLAGEGRGFRAGVARRASPLVPNDLEYPRKNEWMVDVVDVLVAAALFLLVLGFVALR
jgi:hypothetical protein